jgi:hypothetical protein
VLVPLVALVAAVVGSACRSTFVEPRVASGAEQRRWSSFYVFGTFGGEEMDARDVCPNGRVRHVRAEATPLTLLVSVVTIGMYTPRVLSIRCGIP